MTDLNWRTIHTLKQLNGIGTWIKKQGVNCTSTPIIDKNGSTVIKLGYVNKPHSDFGKFQGYTAAIVIRKNVDVKPVVKKINNCLGIAS